MLLLGFCSGTAVAQLFTEVSSDLGINYSFNGGSYGGGVSFFDADHNGWDDITFCTNGNGVIIYQNFNGVFSPPVNIFNESGQVKQAIWIDYDNDGDSDLFITRYFGKWSLLQNTGSILNLTDVTESSGLGIDVFPQSGGSSWADIDNDGFLDVYIPNYDYTIGSPKNFMYHNNGDGTFSDVSESSGTEDGNKASFQGLFFDYDQNGTQDLFVINDRILFANSFFRNDGNGIFDNNTITIGLEQYIFSMNASISDINHDGQYELYVSNNPTGNSLFSYDPELQQFHDISSASGTQVFDHSWAANWLDADNDTWEDLHVAISPFWGQPGQDQFFFNNGDGTFTMDISSTGFDGDATISHSTAIGDFNNDGFSDLVVVNNLPQTSSVYQNNGNNNHYLKVALEGVNCNRDAFGARIEVYLGDELLVKTLHGGECYMTQNSKTEIFGLGAAEMVDSLSVIWPGGFTETAYNINVDQKIKIVEGEITEIYTQPSGVVEHTNLNLCTTDSILLSASNNLPVLWNNQVFGNSIWVTSAGEYHYSYTIFNTEYYSDTIDVFGTTNFDLDLSVTNLLCAGQPNGAISFEVVSNDAISDYLLDGELNADLENLFAGAYQLNVLLENGCELIEQVVIEEPDELLVDFIVDQALCFPEVSTVSVNFSGGTAPVNVVWDGFDPDAPSPGIYEPYVQDFHGCITIESIAIEEITSLEMSFQTTSSTEGNNGSIESTITGGAGDYQFNWSGPDNFTSQNQNLYNLAPGMYSLIALDANGCWEVYTENISATSIDEISRQVSIFPNPARNNITIEHTEKITKIELFDTNGRLLFTQDMLNQNEIITLRLESYARGVILLKISTSQQILSRVIMLE
ncbi:MAG: hypothetical protein ACJAU0_001318 [Flavobacteriales bacterium]|jgi:hypothetical protein